MGAAPERGSYTNGTPATSLLNAGGAALPFSTGSSPIGAFVAADAQLMPERPAFQKSDGSYAAIIRACRVLKNT